MNKKNVYIITTFWMGIFLFLTFLLPAIMFANQSYDLDDFDDLELESLEKQKKRSEKSNNYGQRLILFDDNLYLLDDDFDFGADELELQKLELDPDDMETAQEYETFLNAFFENSTPVGSSSFGRSSTSNQKYSKTSKTKKTGKTKKNSKYKASRQSKNRTSQTPSTSAPTGKLGFGVAAIATYTYPITMAGYPSGTSFGLHLDTPVSFNLGNMEAKLGTELYFTTMKSDSSASDLKITNIVANVGISPISSIEVRVGLGYTPASIGTAETGAAFALPIDLNYYLPINLAGFRVALNLHAQRTFGYPGGQTGDSTDFINLGFLINTPLAF